MRKLLDSPWQTLSIPFALTPIGQLHQPPPSPVPGDLGLLLPEPAVRWLSPLHTPAFAACILGWIKSPQQESAIFLSTGPRWWICYQIHALHSKNVCLLPCVCALRYFIVRTLEILNLGTKKDHDFLTPWVPWIQVDNWNSVKKFILGNSSRTLLFCFWYPESEISPWHVW